MNAMRFGTEMFRGKEGYIGPIIDQFTTPEHFNHYHVTMHQGNTRLAYWTSKAIRDSGRPVLHAGNSMYELLPTDVFPDQDIRERPYKIAKKNLFVRLDMLPVRYEHPNARNGGLGESEEFLRQYKNLKAQLQKDVEHHGLKSPRIAELTNDPSIVTGAQLSVFPGEQTWKQIVWYAMKEYGIWDDGFQKLTYSPGDNCIEHYPTDFDYGLLVPLIKEFGGWIDFTPSKNSRRSMACNFTTCGNGEKGLRAIVQNAFGEPVTKEQKGFMEMTYRAFGLS